MKVFVATSKEYRITFTAPKQSQKELFILLSEIIKNLNKINHRAKMSVKTI